MIKEIRSKFDMKTINLIHVIVTGTLLACIGYKKDRTPKWKFYGSYDTSPRLFTKKV